MNKKLLVALALSLSMYTSQSTAGEFEHFNKWDTEDKVLLGVTYTAGAVDVLQTHSIFHQDDYKEFNPIINAGVDKFGHKFITPYFVASGLLVYTAAGFLKGKKRTTFLSIMCILESAVVINNDRVGVRLKF